MGREVEKKEGTKEMKYSVDAGRKIVQDPSRERGEREEGREEKGGCRRKNGRSRVTEYRKKVRREKRKSRLHEV